jgi:hypothetical protein
LTASSPASPSARSSRPASVLGHKKINFSTVFAGQAVGIKEVHDDIWLVRFMDYDLGYFDLGTRVLEPLDNPFGPKVLPMCPVRSVTYVSGPHREILVGAVGSKPRAPGISTAYEAGLGMKKKDLVVLGTLIAASMPPFSP